jgi:hypothetical protein
MSNFVHFKTPTGVPIWVNLDLVTWFRGVSDGTDLYFAAQHDPVTVRVTASPDDIVAGLVRRGG